MRFAVFLFSSFAVITGFLIWRSVPRPLVFAILLGSATIYALSFFVGLWIADAVKQELVEGFVPYFLPLPVIALYIAWHFTDTPKLWSMNALRSNQPMKPRSLTK